MNSRRVLGCFLSLFAALSLGFQAQAKVILWDLGDTLLHAQTFSLSLYPAKISGMTWEIGISNSANFFFSYLAHGKKPSEFKRYIHQRLFDVLSKIGGEQVSVDGNLLAKSTGEWVSPQIMCDWFAGTITGEEIYKNVCEKIDELDKKSYFISNHEKLFIRATIRAMFDSKVLGNNMKPIEAGVKILEACAEKLDTLGNQEHKLYILSNMDKETFEIIYNNPENQKIFKHFRPENIIVSAHIGLIKPHRNIFEHTLAHIKAQNPDVKNEDCVFIDDRLENRIAAESCGIKSYDCRDYDVLEKQLKKDKILGNSKRSRKIYK